MMKDHIERSFSRLPANEKYDFAIIGKIVELYA